MLETLLLLPFIVLSPCVQEALASVENSNNATANAIELVRTMVNTMTLCYPDTLTTEEIQTLRASLPNSTNQK